MESNTQELQHKFIADKIKHFAELASLMESELLTEFNKADTMSYEVIVQGFKNFSYILGVMAANMEDKLLPKKEVSRIIKI